MTAAKDSKGANGGPEKETAANKGKPSAVEKKAEASVLSSFKPGKAVAKPEEPKKEVTKKEDPKKEPPKQKKEEKKPEVDVDMDGSSTANVSKETTMKRKREQRVDTIEYEFCDGDAVDVSFPTFKVPKGSTGATVQISWNF